MLWDRSCWSFFERCWVWWTLLSMHPLALGSFFIYPDSNQPVENTSFWERLKVRGEGDDGGWDGWIASLTQWTWVISGSWWWTGRPGMLQSMRSQKVRHDWATELNWTELKIVRLKEFFFLMLVHFSIRLWALEIWRRGCWSQDPEHGVHMGLSFLILCPRLWSGPQSSLN